MLEKICPVHNVPVYGDKCIKDGCEARPLVSTTIYWCEHCKVPVFEKECDSCGRECTYMATDLRPVFPEEKLLLAILMDFENPLSYEKSSVWNSNAGYFVDGKRIELSISEINSKSLSEVDKIREQYDKYLPQIDYEYFDQMVERFVEANRVRYHDIVDEAINYIQSFEDKYTFDDMFISFSGGKDSTVTSDLVMKAFANSKIMHIFGDTTLEFPLTEEYRKRFSKKHTVIRAKNYEKNFEELCEQIGPPSRVMRWCCTVFKTGAITRKIEQTFKNTKRLLSFQGIRRLESLSRSKYERDTDSPKITKQLVSAPIIDWSDFDVWLYILSNKITFNKAYCQGFSRVGCWCCPNNSAWSEYLSAIYMNDKYAAFKNTLYSFAKKVGKQDWKEYIDEGNWRARQGGNGLEHSKNAVVSFKPCALDENSVNFTLSREISEDFYTFLKPFGIVNFDIGNKRLGEVYVLSRITMEPIFKVSGKIGKNELKITINNVVKPYKNAKEIIDLFRNQITKYQTCIGCTYCQSVCKFNALKVNNLNKGNVSTDTISYIIDENKCVGCLECVKHFDGGCYMKKVLRTKKGE